MATGPAQGDSILARLEQLKRHQYSWVDYLNREEVLAICRSWQEEQGQEQSGPCAMLRCNPFVASCGATFCTYEETAQHEATCHAVAAPAATEE